MPIPTKKPTLKTKTGEVTTTAPIVSSRQTRSTTEQADSQSHKEQEAEVPVTSGSTNANLASNSVQPRPPSASKQVSGTVKPTRPLSTNTGTTRSTSESSKSVRRPTPTSSTISRQVGSAQSRTTAPSTKPKPESNTSRLRTTSTANTVRITANTASKSKPASTIPAPSRTVRSLKDTNSASSSQAKSSVTKSESPQTHSRIDDELFQLRLLHSNSHHNLHSYKQSIRTTIAHKQTQLETLQTEVLDLEAENTQALSINALATWLDATDPTARQSQIQQLSSAIQDLDALKTSPSALAPLQVFDDWLIDTLAIREQRTSSPLATNELVFIQSLGHSWTGSMRDLQQTLSTILTTLQQLNLEDQDAKSGIGVVLTRHREFASILLQEVETALAVEKGIMRDEMAWEAEELERAMNGLLGENGGDGDGDAAGDVGVYQGIWA